MGNPAFHQLLIGRRLASRYEVREVLGRGGMSVVYLADDEVLEREVALKVIDLPSESDAARADLRSRFRREAAAAARIGTHPHVVQVHDFGTDAQLDLDFIVMERLRGRDLKAALQDGALPLERAQRILLETARGVAAGHGAGLVHRDVKTANVFLVEEGEREGVRVLDFGIAKALDPAPEDDLTRTAVTPHSPAYASPEQLRGLAVGAPSDVYQLGLLGYELLAGERPFDELERERLREAEAVPLPWRGRWEGVPAAVRAEIGRALEPHPGDRHPDAAAFAAALAGALHGAAEPPSRGVAPPPSATEDETVLMAGPPRPAVPASGAPSARPSRAPAARTRRAVLGGTAVLVMALAVVQLVRREAPAREEEVAEQAVGAGEAEEGPATEVMRTFRPLLVEASLELSGEE